MRERGGRIWGGVAILFGFVRMLSASDVYLIEAAVESVDKEGKATLLAAPKLTAIAGEWVSFSRGGEISVPTSFSLPIIPARFSETAYSKEPGKGDAKWKTHSSDFVVEPYPTAFELKPHGLTTRFRVRKTSGGALVADCEAEWVRYEGVVNEADPIVVTSEGAGGKLKKKVIAKNIREKFLFTTRAQTWRFLSGDKGFHGQLISDELVDDPGSRPPAALPPKMRIQLNVRPLEGADPPEEKRKNSSERQISYRVRVLEIPFEVVAPATIFTDAQFQLWVRAMNQTKGVDLLTAPTVLAPLGTAARVEVTREFIYPKSYQPPEVLESAPKDSFPVSPGAPEEFETRNLGVSIELNGRVLPDGRMEIEIQPEVSEFKEFTNLGKPIVKFAGGGLAGKPEVVLSENKALSPSFDLFRSSSVVRIPPGAHVAMGGWIREETQSVEDKVPFLGDLPLIGKLGRTQTELHIRRRVIFVISPELVNPDE